MPKIIMTVDDSPSRDFRKVIEHFNDLGIKAVFYCRGDYLKEYIDEHGMGDLIFAFKSGHTLGNHCYSHQKMSDLSIEEARWEITKTHGILESIYMAAKIAHPDEIEEIYTMRFPYVNSGLGVSYFPDLSVLTEEETLGHNAMQQSIVNQDAVQPSREQIDHAFKIQEILKQLNYTPLKANGVRPAWFQKIQELGRIDSVPTWSSNDWTMKEKKHFGKQGINHVGDLKSRITSDMAQFSSDEAVIALAHDYGPAERRLKDNGPLERMNIVNVIVSHLKDLPGVTFQPPAFATQAPQSELAFSAYSL